MRVVDGRQRTWSTVKLFRSLRCHLGKALGKSTARPAGWARSGLKSAVRLFSDSADRNGTGSADLPEGPSRRHGMDAGENAGLLQILQEGEQVAELFPRHELLQPFRHHRDRLRPDLLDFHSRQPLHHPA